MLLKQLAGGLHERRRREASEGAGGGGNGLGKVQRHGLRVTGSSGLQGGRARGMVGAQQICSQRAGLRGESVHAGRRRHDDTRWYKQHGAGSSSHSNEEGMVTPPVAAVRHAPTVWMTTRERMAGKRDEILRG